MSGQGWVACNRDSGPLLFYWGHEEMPASNDLHNQGFARLGILPWIGETVAFLAKCQKYSGHIKARPRLGMECAAMEDVMVAPNFLRYAKSLTPIVSKHFGEPAILWSLNAFYTNRDTPYFPGLHGLHKDRGGDKIVALFVLGYDTPIDSAQLHMLPSGLLEPIYGPAGTAWLADNTQYHMGLIPSRPRMLMWARWAEKLPKEFYSERLPSL